MKKIMGYTIIALVFIAIFLGLANKYGFSFTALAFLGAIIITGIIVLGVWLIVD